MEDSIHNIKEELKRADHLLYVSLKYTRTVDVIKSIIDRLVNAFDHGVEALLKYAVEKKMAAEAPTAPTQRINAVQKLFADNLDIKGYMEFYALLRKINRAEFTRAREFRRHVTMTVIIDNQQIEVDIDKMHEYFNKTTDFLGLVEKITGEKKND